MIMKVKSCAVAGRPGLSAYQIAVLNGYTGSEEQWLASLKGDKGDTGAAGQNGTNGTNGADGKDAVIWYANKDDIEPDSPSGYYIGTNLLEGPEGAVAAAGQLIIASDDYAYFIKEIYGGTIAVLSSTRLLLKGSKGDTGANGTNAVIWYTTDAPSSRVLPSAGGVFAAESLQGPTGAAVAAGQMIVSSNTGKAYWTAGPVEDGAVPLALYDVTIAAT